MDFDFLENSPPYKKKSNYVASERSDHKHEWVYTLNHVRYCGKKNEIHKNHTIFCWICLESPSYKMMKKLRKQTENGTLEVWEINEKIINVCTCNWWNPGKGECKNK